MLARVYHNERRFCVDNGGVPGGEEVGEEMSLTREEKIREVIDIILQPKWELIRAIDTINKNADWVERFLKDELKEEEEKTNEPLQSFPGQ